MTRSPEPPAPRPHDPSGRPSAPAADAPEQPQVTLRGPADLVDALPYLLGFRPDDSVVMIGMHGTRARFGSRHRIAIPSRTEDWSEAAARLADDVVNGAGPGRRPDGVTLFLCQDAAAGEEPLQVVERLRPLAQRLRTECGALDVPVVEALCVSSGRWWSYTCPSEDCCSPQGTPVVHDGTSVMAAAAAYAGIRVRGSVREMEACLLPLPAPRAASQHRALNEACAELLPRMLGEGDRGAVKEETLALSGAALERFRAAAPPPEGTTDDARDDALLSDDEAAAIILGLQDREARDRVAEWIEGAEAPAALRLWKALARRCVGPYANHAAAPLTLAGWVSWSGGDEPSARVAFGRALEVDPHYAFARLLHQACSHGIDPEPLRRSLRGERADRQRHRLAAPGTGGAGTGPGNRQERAGTAPAAGGRPGGRTRVRSRHRPRSAGEGPSC